MNTLFQNACFYSKFIVYCLTKKGKSLCRKNKNTPTLR